MTMTISEDQIATTDVLAYNAFLLLKRGTTDVTSTVYEPKIIPAFYGPHAVPEPTYVGQLFIEVADPADAAAIARVRLALTERFKDLGHPRTI